MANSAKYTTVSILRKDKKKLDFIRAKFGKSLSVVLGEMIEDKYTMEFGTKGEVVYASTEGEETNAVVVV